MKQPLFVFLALAFAKLAAAVTIDIVPVGNTGNLPDTTGWGAVAYEYQIGKFEITNLQYADFLNSVAASDPLELYDLAMTDSNHGGIIRNGVSGSYSYSTKAGFANRPVSDVSWFDTVRFVNWLNNGQSGAGSTEYGAYTLEGGTPTPSNAMDVVRSPGAVWVLPTVDEWYKAAYYDPKLSLYFDYATSSNSVPATDPPPGLPNTANYDHVTGRFTDVGAFVNSPSPFGTFDQGGNAEEWNEDWSSKINFYRYARGGQFSNAHILKTRFSHARPDGGGAARGFRVATLAIPEPTTLATVAIALIALSFQRRQARSFVARKS